jgi:2-oxoglutarate dehydrogenase E2 component (dihydrolipoamide succinyltransferase)
MPNFEIKMPKLGESVEEATITKWFVKENDLVEEEQPLLEIATDKVDSEIPSPVSGKIVKIFFKENDKIAVGTVIALIDTDSSIEETTIKNIEPEEISNKTEVPANEDILEGQKIEKGTRFYSPLVKSISKKENISLAELESIPGSGKDGRVQKEDILKYIENRKLSSNINVQKITGTNIESTQVSASIQIPKEISRPPITINSGDEIIEMDRMRKLIAEHMLMSKQVSPHVTAVVEADVTNLVLWREKNKAAFEKRENVKLTYMPVFTDAVAKALKDFPMVNSSVDGTRIILKKAINIGIAVALPTGNLIVPVLKDADKKNLPGLAAELNRLADNARKNKLSPDDVQGGTFTITNFGTFRNLFGTPIINQPQVAILATGTIEKKPAVLETPTGDVIAIRHKMYLSLSYDHRIVDGALGGAFLRRVADYLEGWDLNKSF